MENIITQRFDKISVGCYVHIPFCVRKCAYCDFNSFSGFDPAQQEQYVRTLISEIEGSKQTLEAAPSVEIDTIFFGGGTPTALSAKNLCAILDAVRRTFPVAAGAEITTEANPGSVDLQQLELLRCGGFNRISFGVQSFDQGLLKTLDHIHSADEAVSSVNSARCAGFENISIDLMFALPRQTMYQWRQTLDHALELRTEHLSVYALIVEEGTGFWTLREKGRLPLPSEDLSAEMYEYAVNLLSENGYQQYEISNYAKAGMQCRHNLHYWRNEPYLGFGCGAASYEKGARSMNIKPPLRYAAAVARGDDPREQRELLSREDAMAETMILGLRLTEEGVDNALFRQRFGIDPREAYPQQLAHLEQRGLLDKLSQNVRLAPEGVFLASEAMLMFLN